MFGKSLGSLSVTELEELIRQRRGRSYPSGQGAIIKPIHTQTDRNRRGWWEKALLVTEILLLVGLLFTFGISARGWLALRQKLPLEGVTLIEEAAWTAPPAETSGPTPLPPIGWRNSPAANQSPGSDTEALNRLSEIPAHLQGWLQPTKSPPTLSLPEPVVQPATRIIIPSINVDAPVGEGTDWESLKYKVGHHPGTANPGQRGNMVLAAHNDVYGEIFRYLPDVPLGEMVTVYAGEQIFRYRITERRFILPEQTEVMLPTTGPTLTLISCYPYLIDTHRIILFGELIS
ncbi:MAG: hypothetical protein DPW09_44110 [Anaerolineae bacterium]|nr:hypothetical protein [Anaerolineae bacterium]GIK37010.1 MAG: hypothetical protein BroJett011_08430 [Chloroflexota bacterium]